MRTPDLLRTHGSCCRTPRRLTFVALPVLAVLLAGGCAKTGEPLPPVLLIPRPANDLQVRQYAAQALLTVSLPLENTNGTPVSTLDRVEVLRVLETDRTITAPPGEDEFVRRARSIAEIAASDLPSHTFDGKLAVADPLGLPDPGDIYRVALRYAVRFVNDRNQTAGISNQAYLAPVPIPAPPDRIASELNPERIRLTWSAPGENADGSTPPLIAGYNVYRGETASALSLKPLNDQPLQKAEFEDRNFEFDKTYHYAVSVVGKTADPYAESTRSQPIAVEARDTFPPGAPDNLNAILEAGAVILLWSAPPETDVAGYRVYRTVTGQADGQPLESSLVKEPSYRDSGVRTRAKYVYRVHAVDARGNEGPGAEAAVEVP